MSNYWKKRLEELERNNNSSNNTTKSSSSRDYWREQMDALDRETKRRTEERKKKEAASTTEDIAPVKDERKWFQKGAFEDGYQFGDLSKTLLGSSKDLSENFSAGILGMGEKVVDAGAYLVGGAAKLVGADEFADKTKDFIAKDLYDEEKLAKTVNLGLGLAPMIANKILGIDSEEHSVFGEKTDSLAQSGGQLAATFALNAAGVPWFLTTGVTSFGTETENAFRQDASYLEAGGSALISAGAEILTEKLFGGIKFGGKTVDDVILKPFIDKISSKALRTLVNLGVDTVGEGAEEFLSSVFSNIGSALYKEESIGELLTSEEATDEYLESIIGGMLLGGGMGGFKATSSIASGRDYKSGLTTNEQKVLDKVYEERIAEAEKGGEKLSTKDKNKIYDEVLEDLKKGGISTDTIESVLGGDAYKSYQDTVSSEDALIKELEELRKMKKGEMNDIQQDRLAELKAMNLTDTTKRDSLRAQLSESVQKQLVRQTKFGTQTDNYLIESYNERGRRGQAFQADPEQYKNEYAKQTVQNALEFNKRNKDGLHNGREAHDFIDLCVKVAEDKGKVVDFTTTAEMAQAIKNGNPDNLKADPNRIEAYNSESGNKLVINMDVNRSLTSLVGHEITDMMRGAKDYSALQKAAFSYAETKGELETRRSSVKNRYKTVNADLDGELTSDLVGDYLFTDSGFIQHLSTNHRNVFQKIYDEIKYLYKLATTGSKEARQLEKLKHEFEKVWRDNGKSNNKASADTKYSLAEVEAVQPSSDKWKRTATTAEAKAKFPKLWDVTADESEVRNPTQISQTVGTYRRIYDYLAKEGFNGTILDASSGLGYGTKAGIEEYGFNVEDIEPYPDNNYKPKYTDYSTLDKKYDAIISSFVLNVLPQDQRDALVVKMGELLNDGGRMFVNTRSNDVESLAKTGKNIHLGKWEWIETARGSYQKGFTKDELVAYLKDALGEGFTVEPTNFYSPVAAIVTKNGDVKYSLSDSDGKQLTKEQSEYFKDSKMRDESGNLKVMYHGSQDAGFHTFDAKMSDDDTSFFFVDRNDVAASYSGTTETYEAQTIRTAEDMNNFIESIGVEGYEVVEKDGKFTLLYEGERVADSNTAQGIYDEFCWYEGVGEGDANYKVYLNLTNPLVVDAEGRNWNNISREYSQEIADRYNSLTADERAAMTSLASWEEISIFRDEIRQALADTETGARGSYDEAFAWNIRRAYEKLGGNRINMYDLFTIASENFSEDSINQFAVKQMNTRDYAQKAKAEGYDGVIFNNIVDVGGYGNGSEGASTVAIAFDSNQIKSVANEKPTGDPDIRYSLSDSEQGDNGVKVMDGGSVTKYSLSTWTPETQTKVRENLIKSGYDADKVDKWIKDTNSVASVIAADKARLDFVAADNQVMLKDNQEYIKTLDASTLCAKRLVYQGTFDAIQHRLPNTMLSSDDLIDLLNMMKEHGVQTPCGVCYVESRRRHLGKFAQGWLDSYNGEYKPNLDEVTTSDGLEALRKSHPQTYKDFVDAMNKKGSSNPKVVQLRTEYRNEIMSLTPKQIQDIEAIGGLRVQSFSDFETPHMLDMMQAVMDMSAKGLHSQAYTKVPNFAWVFGDTGIKINLSLIAEGDGFDADGNLAFSATEGMNIDEAMKLRDAYSQNVGTIIVGANDKHILACMADDRIDFIIPFHRSGWGMKELEMMGMSSYTDYTYGQKEHDLATGKGVANLYPADYWDYTLSGKENAERYLNLCARTGREPKFSKFLVDNGDGSYSLQPDGSTDGYWKTLIDFKMYDNEGNGAAQQKVQPNFNMEEAYRVLGEYEGGANKLPVANDVVEEFVAKYNSYQDLAPAMSLSAEGETPKTYGNFNIFSKDIRLAPTQEEIAPVGEVTPEGFAPISEEAANAMQSENIASLDDTDVPPEVEAPYYDSSSATPTNPFESRDYKQVGNRKVKAYMYENPEVKPFFTEEAEAMLGDLERSTKGERWYNDELYYESNGEQGFSGTKRHTTDDIAYLLDSGYTYEQIEKALKAIIETDGATLNACGKRIEFLLNDRLMNGYRDVDGLDIPANQEYINLLNQMQTKAAYQQSAEAEVFTDADAPLAESTQSAPTEDIAPVAQPKVEKQVDEDEPKIAKILTEEPQAPKKKNSILTKALANFADKGIVFENLAKKTHNRELEAKYNFLHYSESRAQEYIADNLKPIVDKVTKAGTTAELYNYVYHLHNIDRMSLETEENRTKRETLREQFKGYTDKQISDIAMEWIKRDTPQDVKDRIKVAREYVDTLKGKNKPVFDDSITADTSREVVKQLEAKHPEFKELSEAIVEYNTELRNMLVRGNVISQETADLWAKIYPHYVPIRRVGKDGAAVNVPLDTNKTGINAPIKRATGGNSDILPLFDTMALRTEQTFKAIAKNSFGTELMHTLDSVVENEATSLDEVIDNFDNHEELLQEGKNGKSPTFTVFEDGKRVTFEITEDMYDALKPTSKGLSYTNKVANTASNIFRGLLTEYNPVFMATNAVKDVQDILINSRHATRTYLNIPTALKELTTKGRWYTEYMKNGGSENTYFDSDSKTFKQDNKGFVKAIGMPLRAISTANNFIERVPRLAEYIASRKSGTSIETAMLDAARVTTNFAAGGDVTKFLNRNGFTFLNASAQGAMQQVRNVREAKAEGLKGWMKLATKTTLAGVSALLLNHLLWDDDEEYEELSDYVKQNYYIVAKFGDGKFVRIPKGRTVAVIQEAFKQMENLATGNDEADLEAFLELAISNLAPNNPLENNILAPFMQVANNKTWYGEDLVPTRLQDLPAAEQYDESTDAISKWLGEKLNVSPYKLNYLLNQYSGGVGDVLLPMITPEAESGDNSFLGNITAPFKDKFTTDSVMNNQNVSDFYDTMDELAKNAKSMNATDKDVLKYKYLNSVNADLSKLYAQKREIQNSNLADDEKYEAVREIQRQIDELARESLNTYKSVYINNGYAVVGDRYYKLNDKGEWQKLSDDQYEKQEEVTNELGIDPSTYWRNKSEYDFAYEYPEKYAVAKSVGGYEKYKQYASELYDIKADKDEYGKSISGSRKEKVIDYINNLDADYGEKIILFKSQYNADDTYNYEIIDYLNSREDISYTEMETILKELGFTVDSKGNIYWD